MKYKILVLVGFALLIKTTNAQNQIDLYGALEFGSHEVGIKHLIYADTLKTEPTKIFITLWYPANTVTKPLNFSDYLNYKKKHDTSELLQDVSTGIGGKDSLFSKDSLELILNAKMKAGKEALAKTGKFPLLVWSTRYGTVEYQNVISEYIASYGYIVAFVEDDPNTLFPWQIKTSAEKEEVLNQQISDINASIQYLKSQPNIDSEKIGLLSWSYGGESAVLTQMDNPEIDLVVGLSSIGFTYGIYSGNQLSDKIDRDKLNVPYLMLFEKVAPNGNSRTPPEAFDTMHPDSRYFSFSELAHGNFNVMEGMIPGVLNTNKVQSWSRGGEAARIGFEAICEITQSYLHAVFYEDNFEHFDNRTSLQKASLPRDFISIESPKGK